MRLNAVMRGMRVGVLVLAGLSTGASQTLSTLFNFNHTASGVVGEGSPVGSVIVGPDDNFYGMGYGGSVYSISPAGAFTNLHAATPYVTAYAGLALGPDGALYGADSQGVFRVTLSGDLVVINGDQTGSQGGLTVGGDGNFYATDAAGGAAGLGSVFKISQTGALTTLYSFRGAAGIDGSTPQSPLVLGPDG